MNTTQHDETTQTEAESYADRIARERRETAARCATMAAQLAQELTKASGENWTPQTDEEPHYEHFQLNRERDGLQLYVSGSRSGKDHWHIHAGTVAMPDGSRLHMGDHKHRDDAGETSMNAAKAKTPAQIVRDIRRRLFPYTDELCQRAANYHAAKLDAERRRDAIRDRLEKASHYQLEKNSRDPVHMTRWGTPHIRAEIRTHGPDEVKLEFDCTPDQAEQIVRILCQPQAADAGEQEAAG